MQLGSASRTRGAGENVVKSEINVTPLIDIVLVLLIVFMVLTPVLLFRTMRHVHLEQLDPRPAAAYKAQVSGM